LGGLTCFPHDRYIYGFSVFGCACLSLVLGLMSSSESVNFWRVCSIFGYCLLPVLPLAMLGIVMDLTGTVGLALSTITALWCTYSCTRLIELWLDDSRIEQQRLLIAYPVLLLYVSFLLITIY